MKKIILFLGIILILSGCGEKTLTCTSTYNQTNGLRNTTTYLITYRNDDVKKVKVTYHYNQDNVDGVGTGTDGTTNDTDTNRDGVVDGIVGDVIDGTANTILDLAGIKRNYTNQISTYNNITGFKSTIDVDRDNEYKIVYDIDMAKISDTNLGTFNIDRSLNTTRTNYTNQGLTCK